MSYIYSDPSREAETYALPNIEILYFTRAECREYGIVDGDGKPMPKGWYWRACFPGCMPDGGPFGPFDTEAEAIADAQADS